MRRLIGQSLQASCFGEEALRRTIDVIAASGRVGKETVVKRGKLLLGQRVL